MAVASGGTQWADEQVFIPPSAHDLPQRGKGRVAVRRAVIREVLTAISGIASGGPTGGVLWRGQEDASWSLTSTISRKGITDPEAVSRHEEHLIGTARTVGAQGAQHLGDWEVLARLRHHGAATRLIDVTSDPYVALWFACGQAPDVDAVVLAISRPALSPLTRPWSLTYEEVIDLEGSESGGKSCHYKVAALDPRITAQKGQFVFTTRPNAGFASELDDINTQPLGWTLRDLERICLGEGHARSTFPSTVVLVIPRQVKHDLATMLENAFGLSTVSMYPDFPGLGEAFSLEPNK